MEMEYEVYLENHIAGKVQLTKQGLYYRVLCHCSLPQNVVYRLYGICGEMQENIGVLMPDGDGFLLDRKIPAKRLTGCTKFLLSDGSEPEKEVTAEPESEPEAEITDDTGSDTGTFVPIHPEEPFAYLHKLESAFYEEQNGQIGARIQENPGTV